MMEQQVNYPCETLIAFPQVDRHDQGQGTIRVVELTTPCVRARSVATLLACDLPKSSALMINKRPLPG